MDAQPAQSILAREVKNAERHADDSAVEGHATLPQFEDVERVFKNRWLIEKHISHSPAQNDAKRSIEDHVVCMATSHRRARLLDQLQQIPIADQDARQIGEGIPFERKKAEIDRYRIQAQIFDMQIGRDRKSTRLNS